MTLDFLPEALAEFGEAAEYYEAQREGLGERFRQEVLEVCQAIAERPLLWRERPNGCRRVNCPVFPFYVAYFIRGNLILIAAVAHGHRRPGYWRGRLGSVQSG